MIYVKKLHEKYHFAGFSKMVVARNSGFLAMNKRKKRNKCKKTAKTVNKKCRLTCWRRSDGTGRKMLPVLTRDYIVAPFCLKIKCIPVKRADGGYK